MVGDNDWIRKVGSTAVDAVSEQGTVPTWLWNREVEGGPSVR